MLYRVTQMFDREGLIEFLSSGKTVGADIQAVDLDGPVIVEKPHLRQQQPEPRQSRTKRGSKVNATILAALRQNGPLAAGVLKTALIDAGLAAGSLSTGLAQLQKGGEVERTDDGLYGLKAA